jgi:hypothetical protein
LEEQAAAEAEAAEAAVAEAEAAALAEAAAAGYKARAERRAALADRAAAAAEMQAERAAAQAEMVAEQAAQAEQARQLLVVADQAAAANNGDPFGGGNALFIGGGEGGDLFGATIAQGGEAPNEWRMFINGPKWERRAADPEAVKLLELDRKLNGQIAELAAKYKSLTDDEQRADVAKELAARVGDQFTVRQSMRERDLVDLEEQVKRLRDLQDKRSAQRDRIVNDRVQHLIREAEGLGWGDAGNEFGGGGGDQFKFRLPPVPVAVPAPKALAAPRPAKEAKRVIIKRPGAAAVPPAAPVPVKPPAVEEDVDDILDEPATR